MNVWCHLPTIINRRRMLQIAGLLTLCIALITTLFFGVFANAAPGVNQTISFQGRLLDKNGSPVPDGYYNVQFKIYQNGTGTAAGNPGGTLRWTETHTNNNGTDAVFVKAGYLSVDLGSKNPFGTQVDWNQDTLWLSMNIAGSSAACTTFGTAPCLADGEMVPMKRLTATPYALNSSKLEGKSASDFIQNSTTQQTGNFNISGTGVANTLQGNTSVITPLIDGTAAGTLSIGRDMVDNIYIGNADNKDQTIQIGSGNGNKMITIGTTSNYSILTLQGGSGGVKVQSAGGFAVADNAGVNSFVVYQGGSVETALKQGANFTVKGTTGGSMLNIDTDGYVSVGVDATLRVLGNAHFNSGMTIQGSTTYQTPNGYGLSTAVNIPNYTVGAYGTVFAFGLPASSASTARGMLVADGRTSAHQATIGVLSPDEDAIMGLSWNGSNTKGYISNTANSLALQGGGVDILTATNSSGQARVGIGNGATSGYALDVTGSANVSTGYAINGVSVLNNTGLNFTAASTSTITAASGQVLQLTGDGGVRIGDGVASGQPTLLTVDKSTTTPTATGTGILGSMYYDSTVGRIQCYNAAGWGDCTTIPDKYVSLSPEYSGGVVGTNGTGTMTSDFCSDTLNINDSATAPNILACGANEMYNYYSWTTTSSSSQTRSIYINHKLPANFKRFIANSTSLAGRTSANGTTVNLQVYKNTPTGMVACGTTQNIATGARTTWQRVTMTSTADPANCTFAANQEIVFKIDMTAISNSRAFVGSLDYAYADS